MIRGPANPPFPQCLCGHSRTQIERVLLLWRKSRLQLGSDILVVVAQPLLAQQRVGWKWDVADCGYHGDLVCRESLRQTRPGLEVCLICGLKPWLFSPVPKYILGSGSNLSPFVVFLSRFGPQSGTEYPESSTSGSCLHALRLDGTQQEFGRICISFR